MNLEGVDSYIDVTVLHSALAGCLLVLVAFWGSLLLAALWRRTLFERALPAIEAAEGLGLTLQPTGFRAQLVCRGELSGEMVEVEWLGGVFALRSRVRRGPRVQRTALIEHPDQLQTVLGHV